MRSDDGALHPGHQVFVGLAAQTHHDARTGEPLWLELRFKCTVTEFELVLAVFMAHFGNGILQGQQQWLEYRGRIGMVVIHWYGREPSRPQLAQ